jgi:hypothetical protein
MGLQETRNSMDNEHDVTDLSRQYDESVELERAAWHELHSHPPGSAGRDRAWSAWSDAIMRTNRAWRRLSAIRLSSPAQPARLPGTTARADANT